MRLLAGQGPQGTGKVKREAPHKLWPGTTIKKLPHRISAWPTCLWMTFPVSAAEIPDLLAHKQRRNRNVKDIIGPVVCRISSTETQFLVLGS